MTVDTSSLILLSNANVWIWEGKQPTGKYSNPDCHESENGTLTSTTAGAIIKRKGSFQKVSVLVDKTRGIIVGIHSADELEHENQIAKNTNVEIVDMNGAYMLPGLNDAHIHTMGTSQMRQLIDLKGCCSLKELLGRLCDARSAAADASFFFGFGFDEHCFEEGSEVPTRYKLDEMFPDVPVIVSRVCSHLVACNTAAMVSLGMNPNLPEGWIDKYPAKEIIRDANGVPNGVLTEGAVQLVFKKFVPSHGELKKLISRQLKYFAAVGLTSVQTNDSACEEIYVDLLKEANLPMRIRHTIYFEELYSYVEELYRKQRNGFEGDVTLDELVEFSKEVKREDLKTFAGYGSYLKVPDDSLLSCERIKIVADGALGAKTAALRNPYLSEETQQTKENTDCTCHIFGGANYGILRESDGELQRKLELVRNCGMRVEIHAIGDATAALILKAIEETNTGGEELRPVLTHCQILGDDILEKMANNTVIGNIQPSFLPTDTQWMSKFLQSETLRYGLIWKTMLNRGIICSGGSDSPVEEANPLKGIFDAMYRPREHVTLRSTKIADIYLKLLEGNKGLRIPEKVQENFTVPEAYLPDECLSFDEALGLYTMGAAFAARTEGPAVSQQLYSNCSTGDIAVGYTADFTVVDCNVADQSFKTLREAEVLQTWVGGKIMFDRASIDFEGGAAH